jgi:multiple sugar transport system permease protein
MTDQVTVPAGSQRLAGSRRGSLVGWAFVTPFVILFVLFGLVPVIYSLYLAFTNRSGAGVGLANFAKAIDDFRFWPAVQHVAIFTVIWLVLLAVLVVGLTLVIHRIARRRTKAFIRFAYYIPGALAGASSVLLWLFLLDPSVSPVSWLLRLTGAETFQQVVSSERLPVIFALIAFWTGAGGWILVLYGALNTIPTEVMEAAKVDGAGPIRSAIQIELPMIRKSIVYMLILTLAAGTQLFVEPQLVSQASFGVVPNDYSVNQLAYVFAFGQNDFNGSAAISVLLLVVAVVGAALFVWRGKLFEAE